MQEKSLSHGLWKVTAPHPPSLRKLIDKITVDVAVIGGGYTGLSAALHLAEAGAEVGLLEAREIGFGGAGRNVGLVNAGLWFLSLLKSTAFPAKLFVRVLCIVPIHQVDICHSNNGNCSGKHVVPP